MYNFYASITLFKVVLESFAVAKSDFIYLKKTLRANVYLLPLNLSAYTH